MEVKLGCMLRPYAKYPVARALEGIARAGYRYTAFLGKCPDGGAYSLDTPLEESLALKKQMESFGIKPVTAWASDPLSYGPEGMRRHVAIAQELELEYLLLSSPYAGQKGPNPLSQEETKSKFISIIESVLPECEKTNLRLDVKPHMGPYGTGPGLFELAETIDHPCFGVSYDPGNIRYYEGLVPEEDVVVAAPRVTSICIKDHEGPQRNSSFPNPGEGDVNWSRIFAVLKESGFRGYALIEVMQGETAEALDATGTLVRQRLTEWIAAAGGQVAP
ncbi:MAG: sugar phosphate isomerase/epimerase family protein [Limnochordia bacterium]